jgi:hypothetical protein
MAITKKSGRQHVIHAAVPITYDEFDTTIIGTASTSTQEAIELPAGAIILGGALTVDTVWNTTGVKATGTLTTTDAPSDTNTVTIGTTVYTFVDALSTGPTVPYEVLIGTETVSNANLAAAINGGAGIGTTYSTGTEAHPDVTATSTAHTVVITANVSGTAANSIATTETHANGSWGGVVMSGGVAPADTFTVKIGNETYLTATSVDAAARTVLVPTGTKLTTADTVDIVWDVANTTTVAPTAGAARLEVQYIVDGRAKFSQG